MIPISDSPRGPRVFPFVIILVLVANIAVFVMQLGMSGREVEAFVRAYGVVPAEITGGVDLPPRIDWPIYATLVTSMFIHGGWLHIGSNMLYLWVFGDNVEAMMGHGRFVLFYLLCGVAAAFAQVLLEPGSTVPAVGASGAIAGILGAYVVYFPHARVKTVILLVFFFTTARVAAYVLIGLWILLQVVNGLAAIGVEQTGGVAYWAHIGGFVIGLLTARAFQRADINWRAT